MTSRSMLRAAGIVLVASSLVLAQKKPPQPKSQKEVEAIMAVQNATDPDARIKAAEDLLAKFADTEFKAFALQIAAMSAQQKNDFEKMVIYSERTLEVDKENVGAMLMLANGIAQRTREHDLDKEEKLQRADKLANQALALIPKTEKPNPQITDEQWEQVKKDLTAQANEALGQIALVRKKYDVAIANYKTAWEGAAQPDPATGVRLANAYNQAGKPDEAIAVIDKLMALPDLHPQIKQVAQNEKNTAMKLKSSGAKPPAAAPAPPQVEIKKP